MAGGIKVIFLILLTVMLPARTSVYRFLSLRLWGKLPAPVQRSVSRVYARVYDKPWSRHFIKPYCKVCYDDPNYLDQFQPASGGGRYESFQDFFIRTFKIPPRIETDAAWPCEGLLCEYGKVAEMPLVNVKGDKRHLRTVFGDTGHEIPDDHHFVNVFLHNNNYHRIHAPVNSRITKIERIQGELVVLRPWIYPDEPSLPALRNERVNVDLVTESGEKWYLSIVGGPAVGTIEMSEGMEVGAEVKVGEEIALFLLGSTCCMAMPRPLEASSEGDQVFMGDPL